MKTVRIVAVIVATAVVAFFTVKYSVVGFIGSVLMTIGVINLFREIYFVVTELKKYRESDTNEKR